MSNLSEGGIWCGTCYRSVLHPAGSGGCDCPPKSPPAAGPPLAFGRQVFPLCGAVQICAYDDALFIDAGEPTLKPDSDRAICDATRWPRFRAELIATLDEAAAALGWTTPRDDPNRSQRGGDAR